MREQGRKEVRGGSGDSLEVLAKLSFNLIQLVVRALLLFPFAVSSLHLAFNRFAWQDGGYLEAPASP